MNADAVLDLAMTAYWQADPADVSVNAICQMAGVSKPSLYRAFGNEDGLTRAALDHYAARVLSDVFAILQTGESLHQTLQALIDFACADPRMDTGCLLVKMQAGRHRLGPETRQRLEELEGAALEAYTDMLRARHAAGDWPGDLCVETAARYLNAQIALAVTQRAQGQAPGPVRDMLSVALSVFATG